MKKRSIFFLTAFALLASSLHVFSQAKPKHAVAGVQTRDTQASLTTAQALARLRKGNERFVAGTVVNQRSYRNQVKLTAKGQYPFAAVVSCIDSRVSVDDIFDLNNGDAFNARVAGNVVDTDILGSLEFSTKVAGAKLILVLGHTNCGAIKGACDDVKLGNLTELLARIRPTVDLVGRDWKDADKSSHNHEFVEAVGEANVRSVMQTIQRDSRVIKELVDTGTVKIFGGIYDLETGKVRFLE